MCVMDLYSVYNRIIRKMGEMISVKKEYHKFLLEV